MEPKTPNQIKRLLEEYYDLPQKSQEEETLLLLLEDGTDDVCPAPPNLSGMPSGKGTTGDPTANAVIKCFDEAEACKNRISDYKQQFSWCRIALNTLGRAERKVLELRYMGPKDSKARAKWVRNPTWEWVAAESSYSTSEARYIARNCIQYLSNLSTQEVLNWCG